MLDQGVENKKQLEKVKEVFKEREDELVEDIKTLQVEVENKDKIINVLKRNGYIDHFVVSNKLNSFLSC